MLELTVYYQKKKSIAEVDNWMNMGKCNNYHCSTVTVQ